MICYKDYLETSKSGHPASPKSCQLVRGVKEVIQQHGKGERLKVILETGELKTLDLIRKASEDALEHGADFLKTSTGKTAEGASLEAAKVMLEVIAKTEGERKCGLKISGGDGSKLRNSDWLILLVPCAVFTCDFFGSHQEGWQKVFLTSSRWRTNF